MEHPIYRLLHESHLPLCKFLRGHTQNLPIERLFPFLNHPIQALQRQAAEVLGRLGDSRAWTTLLQELKNNSFWAQQALSGLSASCGIEAIESTLETLTKLLKHQNWHIRYGSACILGKLRDPRVLKPLVKALNDGEAAVRNEAVAEALAELGECAVEPLIRSLKSKRWRVREAASAALSRMGKTSKRAVKPLLKALNDTFDEVRSNAIVALGEIGDPQSIEHLIQALDDENESLREVAAIALSNFNDPRVIDALIQALDDEHWGVRCSAIEALDTLKYRCDKLFIQKLNDPDEWVRFRATDILVKSRAINSLNLALHDEMPLIRRHAAIALGELNDSHATDSLLSTLNEQDNKHPQETSVWSELWIGRAIRVLAKLGEPHGLAVIIKALENKNYSARTSAATTLGEIGDPFATQALIQALKDKSDLVRKAAAEALGKLNEPCALESLLSLLQSTNNDSSTIAEAAHKLNPTLTVEHLEKCGRQDLLQTLSSPQALDAFCLWLQSDAC